MKTGLLLAEATGTVGKLEATVLPEPIPEPEELSLAAGELWATGELWAAGVFWAVGELSNAREEVSGAELADEIKPPVSVGVIVSRHPSLQVTTEVRVRVLVRVTGWLMTADPLVTEVHETVED